MNDSDSCTPFQNTVKSLTDELAEARSLRSRVTSLKDLDNVKVMTVDIIQKSKEGSHEWINAGLFLATLLLQETSQTMSIDSNENQRNDSNQRVAQLLKERGFSYRLSKPALTLTHSSSSLLLSSAPPEKFAFAWDNVLPDEALSILKQVFATDSSFWTSHSYSDGSSGKEPSPYISYIVPLKQNSEQNTKLYQIISIIQNQVANVFPDVQDCTAAEWWAHCRPHSSGHQLHFDSDDEGRGGVRNPVCSTVFNLSYQPLGGETLVTTQTARGTSLATKGWLCSNQQNRLLAFRGDLLHGVVPGPGIGPTDTSLRRITFMVAFWKRIRVQDVPGPGAARPFSRVKEESWAIPLTKKADSLLSDVHIQDSILGTPSRNCFHEVPVWEDVDSRQNEVEGISLEQVKKYKILPPYDEFFQFYS